MIDSLKDELGDLLGLGVFERNFKNHEGIGKTLHTDSNRSMPHVGVFSFYNWIVVSVNDLVQV